MQLQIGKLFLYGRDEDDNIVDLAQAEKHLLLAARYADAEKSTVAQWRECCGQAYFHAAVAAYLIGEQDQEAGRLDSMSACLERAIAHLRKAVALWPQFTEIIYTQAKCHALLGQVDDAKGKFEILSDRDRGYFVKAIHDGDFDALRSTVDAVFKRATTSPGPFALATRAKIDEVAETVAWAKRSAPTSTEDLVAIESIEMELADAKHSLQTVDVDIEGLSARLSSKKAHLQTVAAKSFQSNVDASKQTVTDLEQRKTGFENNIEQLKQTMNATSGAELGCILAIVFFVVALVLTFSLIDVRAHENVPIVVASIMAIAAGIVGSKVSRDRLDQPHKLKIEENSRSVDECTRALPSARKQAERWQHEMRTFASWRAQQPTVAEPKTAGGKAQ